MPKLPPSANSLPPLEGFAVLPVRVQCDARELEPGVFHLAIFNHDEPVAEGNALPALPERSFLLLDTRSGRLVLTAPCGCHTWLSVGTLLQRLAHAAQQSHTH